jgi:hypothetical protein
MDTKGDNSTESHDLPFALSPSVTTDMPQLSTGRGLSAISRAGDFKLNAPIGHGRTSYTAGRVLIPPVLRSPSKFRSCSLMYLAWSTGTRLLFKRRTAGCALTRPTRKDCGSAWHLMPSPVHHVRRIQRPPLCRPQSIVFQDFGVRKINNFGGV